MGVLVLTGIVAGLLAVSGQASSGELRTQVASCERGPVTIGSGDADWRRRSLAAGPLGVFRRPLRAMNRTRNGLLAKMPVLVEGHRTVWLRVPPGQRRRAFLYYGTFEDRQGQPTTSFRGSPGFSEIEFRPCASKPRTVWPGGIRVKGRRPVRLSVVVEGRADPIPLRLGKPRVSG